MAKVFIDGEAGTTGLEIREKLANVPGIELVSIDPDHRKDPGAKTELLASVDVAILCLPDAAAREVADIIDSLGADGPRVLDASTAHRVDPAWVYGFPELSAGQAIRIADARRVANPGCYATGAIAILRPLVDAGILPPAFPLSINAVSGYSGGGRQMIEAYETHRAPLFELYGLGLGHKHVPEIVAYSRLAGPPIFVPSVGNFHEGMIVSVPLHLDALPGRPTIADLEAVLRAHYAGATYVRVVAPPAGGRLDALGLNHTNNLELSVVGDEAKRQAVVLARLDNLGKGASGAAVQNLRLMVDGPA
jgi:N-acetyl-gamma-glutamyl-phosphate reductase